MSERLRRDCHEQNRASWNAATVAHNSHKRDQAGFLRGGGSTLFPEEIELLGPLGGRRVLHLQCNAGQDTLSLAQLGADLTGVDISDEAVRFATQLASDSGIAARFDRADVYDWLADAAALGRQFDVVFGSYGALCWLSDLELWAQGVAGVLAPGGTLVLVDFHPLAMAFDEALVLRYSYFSGDPLKWDEGVTDYVGRSGPPLAPSGWEAADDAFANPNPVWEFQWSIGEILHSLLAAGLRLEVYREYPYSNGCRIFDDMTVDDRRRCWLPDGVPAVPLMYALRALKT